MSKNTPAMRDPQTGSRMAGSDTAIILSPRGGGADRVLTKDQTMR